MTKLRKMIITGGAGFIGSHLAKKLSYDTEVIIIDNLWRGTLSNLQLPGGEHVIDIKKNFHLSDLTDFSVCLELFREVDCVFHLADVVGGIDFATSNQSFIFRKNLLINSNVLTACVNNKIPKYVYVGTACSYPKHLQSRRGLNQVSENQTYPADPESSYGWSKLMGEYEAQIAQEEGGIQVGILRLHNVYGPNVSFDPGNSQVIPSLIRKAIMYPKEDFIVWGSGEQYRDFIYIDDVVDALVLVEEKGLNQGVIQVGSEKAVTIKEIATNIVQISNKNIEIQYSSQKPEGDFGRIANCEKAKKILGWTVKVPLTEGLVNTYEWINRKISKR